MKNKLILELSNKGYTVTEISKFLGCAKSTVSYHLSNNGIYSRKLMSEERLKEINLYYLNHTAVETGKKFNISPSTVKKYCKNKRVIDSDDLRKKKAVVAVVKRRQKIKEMSIKYKGGKCQECGYDKCNGALEFHHLDPNEKDFNLSRRGHCTSWEKVKIELDKCILVCANCHREIHEEINLKIN